MQGKKKILLVDDSKTSLFMERTVLRGGSYDLIEATDGVEAVAKARQERPDLILMDMIMPRMTGLEAVEALRSSADTRSIPIVMVTTRSERDKVEAAHALGCDAYVTKPLDQATLIATVKRLLEEREDDSNG
jgi:CheY-like chemotaxis protein